MAAERAGRDGVFVWEVAHGVDAWTMLAAIAVRTSRIRLGTMLTPLPWRRPWKVASQAATVDQISSARVILTGEVTELMGRSERLDEGIDLIGELWAGRQHYHGRHYSYECERDDLVRVGGPVQDRIPIWVVGAWPRPKSMRRALRYDGVVPQYQLADGGEGTPDDAATVRAWVAEHGAKPDFDLIAEGGDAGRRRSQRGREGEPVGRGRLHLVAGDPLGDAP